MVVFAKSHICIWVHHLNDYQHYHSSPSSFETTCMSNMISSKCFPVSIGDYNWTKIWVWVPVNVVCAYCFFPSHGPYTVLGPYYAVATFIIVFDAFGILDFRWFVDIISKGFRLSLFGIRWLLVLILLTNFISMFHFYTPRKQKTWSLVFGFVTFSGGIEMNNLVNMD